VTFLTFRKKLFPDLSEDTLLLLAEGFETASSGRAKFQLRDLAHAGDLDALQVAGQLPLAGTRKLPTVRIASGEERIIESLIAPKAHDLYRRLAACSETRRLGSKLWESEAAIGVRLLLPGGVGIQALHSDLCGRDGGAGGVLYRTQDFTSRVLELPARDGKAKQQSTENCVFHWI